MDGSTHTTLGPSNAVSRIGETADLICVECQCEADELREDLCADCFENSVDTSWPAMRAEHGTW